MSGTRRPGSGLGAFSQTQGRATGGLKEELKHNTKLMFNLRFGHLWLSWKRIFLQCGRPGFDPWVGKIPLEKGKAVIWPGEFHGLYSPWGGKELDTTKRPSLSLYLSKRSEWLRGGDWIGGQGGLGEDPAGMCLCRWLGCSLAYSRNSIRVEMWMD